MRILIRGAAFVNKGAEAMLRTVQNELGRRIPGLQCSILPEAVRKNTEVLIAEAELTVVGQDRSGWRDIPRLIHGVASRPSDWKESVRVFRAVPTLSAIDNIDAVIDVSGYAYGDPWPRTRAGVTNAYLDRAGQRGIPYIFLPQAWGPFERRNDWPEYRKLVRNATLLFARDETSREHLLNLNATSPDRIRLGPDIAFRFVPAGAERGIQILKEHGLDSQRAPVVGIAPNTKVYERTAGTGTENHYVRTLIAVTRRFRALGASVIVVPHDIQAIETGCTDDRILCSLVAAAAADPQVVAMTGRHTAPDIKAVIGQLQLMAGSRFHALIAALSNGIPAVALGWSHKYQELLRDFQLQDYCIDHDSLERDQTVEIAAKAFEARERLAQSVKSCLPAVHRAVDVMFDEAANLILRRRLRHSA